jgi:hypothetical protein
MRTYEIETETGSQCFVIADNIDLAKELVTEHLALSTKDYFRGAESKVTHEPGVFVKIQKPTVSTNRFLWLVSRTDKIDYDEYDSCVLAARDREEAIDIAAETFPSRAVVETTIIGTTEGPSGIIHRSFNAG